MLENKVRQYLEQTAALNVYWKTAVTDGMLQRELERIAQGTRMPERLVELYAALGNDPFLIADYIFGYDLGDGLLGIRHHGGDTRKLGHATRVRDRLPMAASEKSRIEETPP